MSELHKTATELLVQQAREEDQQKQDYQVAKDKKNTRINELFLKLGFWGTLATIAIALTFVGVGLSGVGRFLEEIQRKLYFAYITYLSSEADMDQVCRDISSLYLQDTFHNNLNVYLPIRDAMEPGSITARQIKSGNLNRAELVKLIDPFADGSMMNNQDLQEANDRLNSKEMQECNDFSTIKEAFNNWATAFINLDFVLAQQYAREFDEWSLYLVGPEKFKISLMQFNQLVFEAEDPRGYQEFLNQQAAIEKILNPDPCALLGEPFSSATKLEDYTFYCAAIDALVANGQIASDENGFPLGYWSSNNAFLGD